MSSLVYFGNTYGITPPFTTAVLANSLASFTFLADATYGMRLSSFKRADAAAQVWTNAEQQLWRANAYQVASAPSLTTIAVAPTWSALGPIAVTTDATGQQIVASWTPIVVGGVDRLTVTLTLRLNNDEDWLRARVACSWYGGATAYALHDVRWLPISVALLNNGTDHAVACIGGGGIDQKNPGVNYRYNPGGGRADTGFNLQQTNRWTFNSGRGFKMLGGWAYYDEVSLEGWSVHMEDWSNEIGHCTHEADATGTYLNWEASVPQPDHVLVNNNGQALGSGYTFCLRPFLADSKHAWIDVGRHYKARWEKARPTGYCHQRNNRSDLSADEKAAQIPLAILTDFSSHALADGKPANLLTRIATARANCGAPPGTRVFGFVDATTWRLRQPGEDADGDLQAMLIDLNENLGCSFFAWNAGTGAGPYIWSIERWHQARADEAELRETTTNDREGAMRMSRKGLLEGGGTDRLGTDSLETGFYRTRNYPITAWDGGTRTLTVTGTPSADGFTGTVHAVLIPAGAGARLSRAVVQTLGAASVTVTGDFTDALGATVTPDATYTVQLVASGADGVGIVGDIDLYCPHAMVNAAGFMERVSNNSTVGYYDRWKARGYYFDTWSEPLMQSSKAIREWCYRSHAGWSQINPGYVQHSLGGGDWMRTARRNYLSQLRTSLRDAQVADGKTPSSYFAVEDLDEGMQDLVDIAFQLISTGSLWRVQTVGGSPVDPAVHQAKAIPLFQIVHAGRSFGRGLLQEFSTAIGDPAFNIPELHDFQAYCLGAEWPYGWTLPVLNFYATDTVPIADLWDNTIYVSGGGTIPDRVKSIRDFYTQIITAQTTWLGPWMPYGEFMGVGEVDFSATSVRTGMAGSTWANYFHSYDTIYDRSAFPRVIHGVWKSRDDGSILIPMSNWTDTSGTLAARVNLKSYGFPTEGIVNVQEVDYAGDLGSITRVPYGTWLKFSATLPKDSIKALLCWRCKAPASLPPA